MSGPKPWHEGQKTWVPADHQRTQEILREALARGRQEQAKGRYPDRKRVRIFELDDVLEIFGPPPHGLPMVKDDIADYLRRAQALKLDGEAVLS